MTQQELTELMTMALAESNKISHWDKDDNHYAQTDINWRDACKLKDRAIALYDKRWQAVKEVIDIVAEELDLDNKGHYLYAPSRDNYHPIVGEIQNYISRSGDKAKMKKRLAELENENAVLRSLVGR